MERVLKNADISVLSNFLAIFFEFFLSVEKFYHVLSTLQIQVQLDHSNRNYRGVGGQNLPFPGNTNLQKAQPF